MLRLYNHVYIKYPTNSVLFGEKCFNIYTKKLLELTIKISNNKKLSEYVIKELSSLNEALMECIIENTI